MSPNQERKLDDLLKSVGEIEFWIKRIAQKLGADKDTEPQERIKITKD